MLVILWLLPLVRAAPAATCAGTMSQMFKIRLPDGSVREVSEGTTPADVAAAIGPGLAKAALAARVNGESEAKFGPRPVYR